MGGCKCPDLGESSKSNPSKLWYPHGGLRCTFPHTQHLKNGALSLSSLVHTWGMSHGSLQTWPNAPSPSLPSCYTLMGGCDIPPHMDRHWRYVGTPSLGANPQSVACGLDSMSHVQGLEAGANMALGYGSHALPALWWSDYMCHHLGRLILPPHAPCQNFKVICKGRKCLVGVTKP